MNKSENGITFPIEATTKTSKQRKKPPNISFQRLTEDDALCPYNKLENYLKMPRINFF